MTSLFLIVYGVLTLAVIALEIVGWQLRDGNTLSQWTWGLIDSHGWLVRGPLLALWLLLGSHLFLRLPH